MGRFSIFRKFSMGLFFGVILPTADITTDVLLMYNTVHFEGSSLELTGCRACFGKSHSDLWHHVRVAYREQTCSTCIHDENNNTVSRGGLWCGGIPLVLDHLK